MEKSAKYILKHIVGDFLRTSNLNPGKPGFKFMTRIIGLASLALLIVGCQALSTCNNDHLAMVRRSATVDESLIHDDECTPPCWQGIIPGQTNEEEAQSILDTLSFIDPSSIERLSPSDSISTHIQWRSLASRNQPLIGSLGINDSGTVYIIQLDLEYELSIETLFSRIGEPDQVFLLPLNPEGETCFLIRLIWLDEGLAADLSPIKQDSDLSTSTLIRNVIYFVPSNDVSNFITAMGGDETLLPYFQNWEGIDSLEF